MTAMQKRVLYIAFLLLAICNKIVAEDQITISDFNLYPGDTKEVSVVLTNQETYVGFQFDLYLPDGITVESFTANSNRLPDGTTPQMAQQSDGSYRFVAASLERNPIVGNDGTVLFLTVKAADNVVANAYTGYLRNVKISKADGSGIVVAEQSFILTVQNKVWSVIGDINGDWDTDTEMTSTDGVNYTATITYVAAGSYQYKIRANGSWDESYGDQDGFNVSVTVPEDNTGVVITFNAQTKEISNSLLPPVYSITGSGPGLENWSGWLAWAQDADMAKGNDGRYSVTFNDLVAGDYVYKVRVNHDWVVDYGANGVRGGENIVMTVPSDNMPVTIYFDPATKLTTTSVDADSLVVEPYTVLSENNTVLTFYYDNKKAERNGIAIGSYGPGNYEPWYENRTTLTTAVFDESFANDTTLTSTAYWFHECINLTEIKGIEYLKTDKVTDMRNMFYGCSKLTTLDVSHFKTDNVTNMNLMFYYCSGLTSLDVKGFNTENVTDMGSMFNNCSGLTSLDLSSFKTEKVKDMIQMFYQCYNLTTIYSGNSWSTASVTADNGYHMFTDCSALVGGMGTTYNANHVDYTYAHIDGGTANPGYFTPKGGYGQTATPTFTHEGNLVFAHSTTEGATIRYTIDGEAPTETTGLVYNDSIVVTRNCTIRAIAIRENFTPSEVAEYNVDWFKVANVEFAQNGHTITLTTQTDGATIHYTLSNSVAGEQIYTAPLVLDTDCTIEAYATREGYTPSTTTSFVFHADGVTCSNPVFVRNGDSNVIIVTTQTENAKIYYTTDGTDPTAQSQLYADSIVVANNMTIKAIVMRENYYPSQVTTFVVDWFKVTTPTLTWNADTLIVYSATDGALILATERLTSDGSILVTRSGVNPMRIDLSDHYYEIWAYKEGWTDSDTLKFYYPYSAWHELLAAVDEANIAIQQATGNDNVPEQMLSELEAVKDTALMMYSLRIAGETVIQNKTAQIRDLTDAILNLANAEAEPYAVLDGTTLKFYYDKKKEERNGMGIGQFTQATEREWNDKSAEITKVVFDESFANNQTITSTGYWFSGFTQLTSIEGLSYLNTSNVWDTWAMFENCKSLHTVDLSHFDTRNVKTMGYMFSGCENLQNLDVSSFNTANVTHTNAMFANCFGLTSLDLSGFNTKKVENMSEMFLNCTHLTTIFAGSEWSTESSNGGVNMFANCSSLVGGMGTVYDESHTDHTYARIDGGTAAPGYFTDINSGVAIYVQASEAPYLYAFDADSNALNGDFPGRQMTDTAMVNGQTFWKTRIYRPVPFNINILDKDLNRTREIYVISDRYFVYEGTGKYVDVTNIYGNAPEIQISSLALPGNHNNWDRTQLFEVVEAGKKYSMEVDLTNVTIEDSLFQFKLFANACAWLGITSLTLDAPNYVHGLGDPASIASDRNIVIDLAGTQARKFLLEATWNGGYQMEEGWTLKITEMEVQPAYTFDTTTGVLTINNETTLADALEAAGGRGEVAKTITAIVWNSSASLTDSDLQGLDNPNMLIYVQSESLAPKNRDNVVVNGFAKNIVLKDVSEGNGDFHCPQAFTAEMISYTHEYRQQTEIGVSRGWETIALPFTVQTIMHETNGAIAPFGNSNSSKHFWLRQLTHHGLAQATQIEANTPYLISMPNSDAYSAEFNLNGRVTFSSQNADVPVTQLNGMETQTTAGDMVMLQPNFKGQSATAMIYALNVGVQRDGHPEGSVFEANYRAVRPFEAFTVHHGNGPAPRFVPIMDIGGTTGIETIDYSPLTIDQWYDLNGRRLQRKPVQKGVYILNGIKVVIK